MMNDSRGFRVSGFQGSRVSKNSEPVTLKLCNLETSFILGVV
jgi:hypothetical protein